MNVLGIESSCDETAIAIVEDGHKVHSSVIASQIARHAPFGGVIPEIAAREHLQALQPLYASCLEQAGMSLDDIDAIAVTQGPGLIGALLVGISFAKGLAATTKKPLIPVNHVHAHIHGALLGVESPPIFPCFAMVISGGHSNLYLMRSYTEVQLLAATLDDACGECFDKVGKLVGLPYPAGPHLEKLARQGDASRIPMPRLVPEKDRLVFSYSGLKTHFMYAYQKQKSPDEVFAADLCAAFQEEALGLLVRKLNSAQDLHPEVSQVLVAGGVAANQRFREKIAEESSLQLIAPKLAYCSDNAAMIAAMGYHLRHEAEKKAKIEGEWDAFSRYPFDTSGWSAN